MCNRVRRRAMHNTLRAKTTRRLEAAATTITLNSGNRMNQERWTPGLSALALVALLLAGFSAAAVAGGRRTGDKPKGGTTTSAPAQPDTVKKTDAAGNKALLAAWKKNIAQWKELYADEPADNSFCYVCHANYDDEKLVTAHAPKGIGCETCHGISDKHSEDEDSLVPPDVLFAKAKIELFCRQCHETEDLVEGDEAHKKFFAKPRGPKDKTCTNCHDMKHSLKVRTRRWDKTTRKLKWSDGVRMMQQRDKDK